LPQPYPNRKYYFFQEFCDIISLIKTFNIEKYSTYMDRNPSEDDTLTHMRPRWLSAGPPRGSRWRRQLETQCCWTSLTLTTNTTLLTSCLIASRHESPLSFFPASSSDTRGLKLSELNWSVTTHIPNARQAADTLLQSVNGRRILNPTMLKPRLMNTNEARDWTDAAGMSLSNGCGD